MAETESAYKTRIKPYKYRARLKDSIIEKMRKDVKFGIKWNEHADRIIPPKTGKFHINGIDFNWNYQYKFSSLAANIHEDSHLLEDLSRSRSTNPKLLVFVAAVKCRMFAPITPFQFIQSNYDPNVNFIMRHHGAILGKRSFTSYDTVEKQDLATNRISLIADRVTVLAATGVMQHGHHEDVLCGTIANDVAKDKLHMLQTAKYIDQCVERNDTLYKQAFSIDFVDLDRNFHMNQGVYCRKIENCLFEYDRELFEGKYFIYQMLCCFKKELRVDVDEANRFKTGKGNTVILANETSSDNCAKRIVGALMRSDEMYAGFECILRVTQGDSHSRL
eukprot:3477_1